MSRRLGLMICSGWLVLAAVVEQSSAQVVITPGAVRFDSKGGAAGARSPGRMVLDGVVRAAQLKPRPLVPIEITDTQTTFARTQLIVDLIDIVFRDLNLAIVGFHNALLARAGRQPFIPAGIFPTTSDTGHSRGCGIPTKHRVPRITGYKRPPSSFRSARR